MPRTWSRRCVHDALSPGYGTRARPGRPHLRTPHPRPPGAVRIRDRHRELVRPREEAPDEGGRGCLRRRDRVGLPVPERDRHEDRGARARLRRLEQPAGGRRPEQQHPYGAERQRLVRRRLEPRTGREERPSERVGLCREHPRRQGHRGQLVPAREPHPALPGHQAKSPRRDPGGGGRHRAPPDRRARARAGQHGGGVLQPPERQHPRPSSTSCRTTGSPASRPGSRAGRR